MSKVSSTVWRLNVDRLMTLSTSAVGGLLLGGRVTQFVEQPRVLDGDDGLGGEVGDQFDLLVGEGPNFLAGQSERTDRVRSLSAWVRHTRPYTAKFDSCSRYWIAFFNIRLLCCKISDVNYRFGSYHPVCGGFEPI